MEKLRRYQIRCSSLGIFITPERADSTGNGTSIRSGNESGLAKSRFVIANSQRPFKFIHSLRTSCGRGYSGRTLAGETSLAQRVLSGPAAGCHLDSSHQALNTKQIAKITRASVFLIW